MLYSSEKKANINAVAAIGYKFSSQLDPTCLFILQIRWLIAILKKMSPIGAFQKWMCEGLYLKS